MNPFSLQVVGEVTKNNNSFFLEKIRLNKNKEKSVNYLFEYEDQPIHLHQIFLNELEQEKVKKKKNLIYLCLENEDLESYLYINSWQCYSYLLSFKPAFNRSNLQRIK